MSVVRLYWATRFDHGVGADTSAVINSGAVGVVTPETCKGCPQTCILGKEREQGSSRHDTQNRKTIKWREDAGSRTLAISSPGESHFGWWEKDKAQQNICCSMRSPDDGQLSCIENSHGARGQRRRDVWVALQAQHVAKDLRNVRDFDSGSLEERKEERARSERVLVGNALAIHRESSYLPRRC